MTKTLNPIDHYQVILQGINSAKGGTWYSIGSSDGKMWRVWTFGEMFSQTGWRTERIGAVVLHVNPRLGR